jgi:hypothetical protein
MQQTSQLHSTDRADLVDLLYQVNADNSCKHKTTMPHEQTCWSTAGARTVVGTLP